MEKKYVNSILILIFCSLNYFLYIEMIQDSFTHLFNDKNKLFFILIIFSNSFILLTYLLFSQMTKRIYLLSRIRKYRSEIRRYKKEYRNRLSELAKKNSMKDEIIFEQSKQNTINTEVSYIAQNWRQPLSVITLLSTSMQFYAKEDLILKNVIKNCEMINKNAQYLSCVIDNFTNAQRTKTIMKKEVFRLDLMLNEFVINNEYYDIQIKVDILDNYLIYTCKQELFKSINNILNNSKENLNERLKKDKKILISVSQKAKEFIIEIKDNAGGIKEDILNSIFEPYSTTKFKTKDVGLGLYLTYMSITHQLEGSIEAKNIVYIDSQSNKEFKGAQFTIKIPRVNSHSQ
ncbi:sensor histidine kinase [Halarcobacter sp.]|uniref:sensor histidine kinase n=2 Tax=Halarcobacter sp. TaxID=2321133 RepID=UPI003B00AA74